jgi:membrane-associated phospholipid phosphatase
VDCRPLLFVIGITLGSWCPLAIADKDEQADVLAVALPASAYLLSLKEQDNDGAWSLTKSLGLTALATLALNSIIDKDSPNGSSSDAFPSGHTSIAFSSAAYIQRRYGWRPGIPAYLVATYVGRLRMETDDHDAADVIGGAAVGIVSSYLLTKPFKENAKISAWADGDSVGVNVQLQW